MFQANWSLMNAEWSGIHTNFISRQLKNECNEFWSQCGSIIQPIKLNSEINQAKLMMVPAWFEFQFKFWITFVLIWASFLGCWRLIQIDSLRQNTLNLKSIQPRMNQPRLNQTKFSPWMYINSCGLHFSQFGFIPDWRENESKTNWTEIEVARIEFRFN